MRSLFRLLIFGLLVVIVITALTAVAATNTVPSTRLEHQGLSFNINYLKPAACSGLSLTTLVTGSGTLTGTAGNDLILASAGADTIDGLGGNDCILGGSADDLIIGNDGVDICIGGLGTDTFTACESENQ